MLYNEIDNSEKVNAKEVEDIFRRAKHSSRYILLKAIEWDRSVKYYFLSAIWKRRAVPRDKLDVRGEHFYLWIQTRRVKKIIGNYFFSRSKIMQTCD